ncbi:hypothetical protein [Streptomyces sp. NPDC085466]|uniref:hypothetical protein n=1 Tax=Streptomyces sp. NPDC085466 TaxID=3365725 RepID=UPI0037D7A673
MHEEPAEARELYNVRTVGGEPVLSPLTDEEERRFRAVHLAELGHEISARGRARFPAHTPEDRRRPADVARLLTEHWGRPVTAVAEDELRMCLHLEGHGPGTGPAREEGAARGAPSLPSVPGAI